MIIDISISVIALAFFILVIYLVLTLKKAGAVLQKVDRLLANAPEQCNRILEEAAQLAHRANALSSDAQNKLESIDPVFRLTRRLGETLEKKISGQEDSFLSKKARSQTLQEESEEPTTYLGGFSLDDILKGITLGLTMWQKYKHKGRRSHE